MPTFLLRLTIPYLLLGAVLAVGQPRNQNGNLMGNVADVIENAALPRAFVYIHGTGGNQNNVVKLDSTGKFVLSLAPGLYDVFVAADGFSPMCKKIRIDPGETTQFVAKLRADVEHAEQNSVN